VIVVEVDLAERKHWPWLGDFGSRIARERSRWTVVCRGTPRQTALRGILQKAFTPRRPR